MKFYIRANEYSQDDIDLFEHPNAFCQRVKKYIIENDSDIISKENYDEEYFEEDFLNDFTGLQKIFDTKKDLAAYIQEIAASDINKFNEYRLSSVLDKLVPDNLGSDRVAPDTQSVPYIVSGYDINTDEVPFKDLEFKNPRSAIIAWFEQSDKHPMAVSINAASIKDAQALLKWVADNEDQFRSWYNKYNIPYKLEYMVNYCKRHQNDSNLVAFSGDQVEPFSLG